MKYDYNTITENKTIRIPREKRVDIGVGIDDYIIINSEYFAQVSDTDSDVIELSKEFAESEDYVDIERVPSAEKVYMTYETNEDIKVKNINGLFKTELVGTDVFKGEAFEETFSMAGTEHKVKFKSTKTTPSKPIVTITKDTELVFDEESITETVDEDNSVDDRLPTFDDIAGLQDEIEEIREIVELPLNDPDLFEQTDLQMPTGILLHGPPGTGKSMLAGATANKVQNATFIPVEAPELVGGKRGESSENIREIFQHAKEKSPAIIFIDEIDAVAPKRESKTATNRKDMVAQLLNSMDGLNADENIVVIGATNKVDDLDPALRRGGRFDREIQVGVPDEDERKELIQLYADKVKMSDEIDIDELANMTHGFVGADVSSLFQEAYIHGVRRHDLSYDGSDPTPEIEIQRQDIRMALNEVEPNGLREFTFESPEVSWDDVGGLEEEKQELKKNIIHPLEYSELYEKHGVEQESGFLLYGPTGTGKTLIAKAIANEVDYNFISVKGPELISKYVGESAKEIRKIFDKARQNAPAIIFIDEIDALAGNRDDSSSSHNMTERVVGQLLTEMDGLDNNGQDITIIGATNKPDNIDEAIRRSGRLGKQLEIGLPDAEGRKEILNVHLENKQVDDELDMEKLAKATHGYVGADIEQLIRESSMKVLERERKTGKEQQITEKDILETLETIEPSVEDPDNY